MSLDKAIKHKKEKRKEYRGSKAWDCSCRNHGGCGYCEGNRTHFDKKARTRLDGQTEEYFGYWGYADPSDAIEDLMESAYRRMGINPHDWDTLLELGELTRN